MIIKKIMKKDQVDTNFDFRFVLSVSEANEFYYLTKNGYSYVAIVENEKKTFLECYKSVDSFLSEEVREVATIYGSTAMLIKDIANAGALEAFKEKNLELYNIKKWLNSTKQL